jgi:hypothetical protein
MALIRVFSRGIPSRAQAKYHRSVEQAVRKERAPAWARAFVAVFLIAFIVCGSGAGELWPLTRWHLFSGLRYPRQEGWTAVVVDAAGRESPLPVGRLPLAYRGAPLLVGRFDKLSTSEQASVCTSLIAGVRTLGLNVESMRIYRITRDVSIRSGTRAAPPTISLRYTCANGSVQAEGP